MIAEKLFSPFFFQACMGAAGTLAESVCHSPALLLANNNSAFNCSSCSSDAALSSSNTSQIAQMSATANGLTLNQKLARHEPC